jgi:hypothetical protein
LGVEGVNVNDEKISEARIYCWNHGILSGHCERTIMACLEYNYWKINDRQLSVSHLVGKYRVTEVALRNCRKKLNSSEHKNIIFNLLVEKDV